MARELYLKFQMGAATWSVYRTEPDDPVLQLDGDPCYAVTKTDENKIYLSKEIKWANVPKFLLHEMCHAAVETSGIGVLLRWGEEQEEQVVRALSEPLLQAMMTGGMFKRRRMPK